MGEWFYKYHKTEPGKTVEPPPEEFRDAAELTLYYAQLLSDWAKVDLFDPRIPPGVWIGLRAYSIGRNRAQWEEYKKPKRQRQQQEAEEKARQKAGAK